MCNIIITTLAAVDSNVKETAARHRLPYVTAYSRWQKQAALQSKFNNSPQEEDAELLLEDSGSLVCFVHRVIRRAGIEPYFTVFGGLLLK